MSDVTHRPFGVEQEHFILHIDGSVPTHSEIDAFYERLKRHGFQARGMDSSGRVLSLERAFAGDPLVVCNDACTHILEVAFPVFNSLELFRTAYVETWDLLRTELQPLGLGIHLGGVIEPRDEVYWRPKDTNVAEERLRRFLARQPQDSPLYHQSFPAWFAATQVSLTIFHPEAYRRLSSYYAFEFLSPLAFSNSTEFQGVRRHCVRTLAWMENYPDDDPLVGIPHNIPQNQDEYERYKQRTHNRDHSFVSIRGRNRIEFRSTCSQNTVEDVIDAVQFRLAVDRIVSENQLVNRPNDPRSHFIEIAKTGKIFDPSSFELLQAFQVELTSDRFDYGILSRRFDCSLNHSQDPSENTNVVISKSNLY